MLHVVSVQVRHAKVWFRDYVACWLVQVASCSTTTLKTLGKWKTLKTEVRKRKYGSEKKKPPGSQMCLVGKRVAVSKRCESQVLIHWTLANTNTAI